MDLLAETVGVKNLPREEEEDRIYLWSTRLPKKSLQNSQSQIFIHFYKVLLLKNLNFIHHRELRQQFVI